MTLNIHGKSYEAASENGVFLFKDIPLADGENRLEVCSGNLSDRAVFFSVDVPEPSYIYVDPNPGLNVNNWFVDEVEKARLFPEGAYSVMDPINTLLESPQVMEMIDRILPKVGAFMRDTIGTFTLEKAVAFAKTLCTEAEVKELNRRLTEIKK